jgi:hypothetical protein
MKRLVAVGVLAAAIVFGGGAVRAMEGVSDEYDDEIMHPLRIAYYLIHPVGYTAEWLVGRPFHYLISRPYLDTFFGYSHFDEESTYFGSN